MAVACDTCTDRPPGCWKAVDYNCTRCYWDAKKHAVATADCPLHKLDACPFTPDRVVIINLKRRQDLYERGLQELAKWHPSWPKPTWFEAIDGWGNPHCKYHKRMKGAWGCKQSHLAVLKQALADGVQSLFVLEGDFVLDEDFTKLADAFFRDVPADWELAYLGGQHRKAPQKIAAGVVRCRSTVRTHAYVAKRSAQEKLCAFWSSPAVRGHIDNALCDHLEKEYLAYAPTRFIVGQGGAKSDILCRKTQVRFWRPDAIPEQRNVSLIRQRRQAVVNHKPFVHEWRNRLTGTQPIIFHAPGKGWQPGQRNELWNGIAADCLKKRIKPALDVMVITWNNGERGILERQLEMNGQPHLVLGRGIKGWKNSMKNYLTCEALKTVKEPYVLGLDAFDVCYSDDLAKTVDLLRESGKRLVQNADAGYWPHFTPPQYKKIEQELSLGGTPWKYINSGAWIVDTEYARWYFAECARLQGEDLAKSLGKYPSSDQVPWHILFAEHPAEIGLDYRCEVFQTDINHRVLI